MLDYAKPPPNLREKRDRTQLSSLLIAETENENLFFKENVFATRVQPTSGFVNEYPITPGNIAKNPTTILGKRAEISSLKVGTNKTAISRIYPNPIHFPQVAINQLNAFKVAPIHTSTSKITVDQFGTEKIRIAEIDITEFDIAQARTTQINGLEVKPTQVTTLHNDASKVPFPFLITPEQLGCSNNFDMTIFSTAIRHSGITKNSPLVDFDISQIGTSQIGTSQIGSDQIGIGQISSAQIGTGQINTIQISPSEIGIPQVGFNQKSLGELSFLQTGISQVSIHQTTVLDVNSTQIDIAQVDTNQPTRFDKESSQTSFSEISLPSSITLQQFLSSYPHLYISALSNQHI
jgi:hypothetical protein